MTPEYYIHHQHHNPPWTPAEKVSENKQTITVKTVSGALFKFNRRERWNGEMTQWGSRYGPTLHAATTEKMRQIKKDTEFSARRQRTQDISRRLHDLHVSTRRAEALGESALDVYDQALALIAELDRGGEPK